jgi:hypothetical protein
MSHPVVQQIAMKSTVRKSFMALRSPSKVKGQEGGAGGHDDHRQVDQGVGWDIAPRGRRHTVVRCSSAMLKVIVRLSEIRVGLGLDKAAAEHLRDLLGVVVPLRVLPLPLVDVGADRGLPRFVPDDLEDHRRAEPAEAFRSLDPGPAGFAGGAPMDVVHATFS